MSQPSNRLPAAVGEAAMSAAPDENSRLDEAMKRADELLMMSLKNAERRRTRRLIAAILIGGIMIAAICIAVVALLAEPSAQPTSIDPQKSAQLAQQGWQLWGAHQPDQAVDKFEQAVKLNPKNTAAWNGLGWSRLGLGLPDQATAAFEKVLELEPGHPAALNGLGQINLSQRKYDRAEKWLLKAAPQAPAAWYGLARLYLLEGKFDQAEKWAQKLVDSGQGDESAKQMLQAAKDKQLSDDLRATIEPPAPATQPAS
jgi:Flp pilus assembly protein TadD